MQLSSVAIGYNRLWNTLQGNVTALDVTVLHKNLFLWFFQLME